MKWENPITLSIPSDDRAMHAKYPSRDCADRWLRIWKRIEPELWKKEKKDETENKPIR